MTRPHCRMPHTPASLHELELFIRGSFPYFVFMTGCPPPVPHHPSLTTGERRAAFTLIELLVVIGIILAMAAIMVPAVSFIQGGSDLGIAGGRISGILEQARAHAMARNTCVWVGLRNVNPGGPVAIASVYSRDGTSNAASTNLIPLGKLISIENVCLSTNTSSSTNGNLRRPTADTILISGSSSVPFSLTKGGVTHTFSNTIGFNSQGIAVTQGFETVPRNIEVGLIPSRNTNAAPASPPTNVLVLQVTGISGAVRTFRP